MKTAKLDDEKGKKALQVEVDWSELAADYDDLVSEYAKVRIPGFRSNKVPRSVVEQRFQRQILDNLSHRAVQRLGREALHEHGAESLGPVEISDVACEKGKPFQFTARFWPMPEFEVPDISSLSFRDDGSDPRDQISHWLLEKVSFTVPDELLREELGADDSHGCKESAAWKAATDRVRLMLILQRIAK